MSVTREYINDKNIETLFEELMRLVISNKPENPIHFLIHTLQDKGNSLLQGKKKKEISSDGPRRHRQSTKNISCDGQALNIRKSLERILPKSVDPKPTLLSDKEEQRISSLNVTLPNTCNEEKLDENCSDIVVSTEYVQKVQSIFTFGRAKDSPAGKETSSSKKMDRENEENKGTKEGSDKESVASKGGSDKESVASKGGSDKESVASKGGSDKESVAKKGGSDKESVAKKGGSDKESATSNGGSDKESEASKGGSDKESVASKGGSDKESVASKGGSDKESVASKGGSDKESVAKKGGSDKESATSNGGSDKESVASKGGSDKESDASKGGPDKENEASKGGSDKESEAKKGGSDKKKEDKNRGSDKENKATNRASDKENEGRKAKFDKCEKFNEVVSETNSVLVTASCDLSEVPSWSNGLLEIESLYCGEDETITQTVNESKAVKRLQSSAPPPAVLTKQSEDLILREEVFKSANTTPSTNARHIRGDSPCNTIFFEESAEDIPFIQQPSQQVLLLQMPLERPPRLQDKPRKLQTQRYAVLSSPSGNGDDFSISELSGSPWTYAESVN
ncbi:uncharacterized protein LOC134814156 isoform X2 [Bolinopsis microptera]|uniref:uncharacterized protein LOC134814156 isoform X2 n=1 Tax=Bolinopsis microptera TaxID=2820187 RepID=UPI003078EB09